MPFYDYQCSETGQIVEISHPMSETREGEQSPFHVQGKLQRLVSMPCNSCADPVAMKVKKNDPAFKDLMNDIHKRNRRPQPF